MDKKSKRDRQLTAILLYVRHLFALFTNPTTVMMSLIVKYNFIAESAQ